MVSDGCSVCTVQVGIALHYSSLSTLLWIGVSARVIYKEAVWRTPRQPEGEPSVPPTQRPMLRSVRPSKQDNGSDPPSAKLMLRSLLFSVNNASSFRQMCVTLALGEATQYESQSKSAVVPSDQKPLCFLPNLGKEMVVEWNGAMRHRTLQAQMYTMNSGGRGLGAGVNV